MQALPKSDQWLFHLLCWHRYLCYLAAVFYGGRMFPTFFDTPSADVQGDLVTNSQKLKPMTKKDSNIELADDEKAVLAVEQVRYVIPHIVFPDNFYATSLSCGFAPQSERPLYGNLSFLPVGTCVSCPDSPDSHSQG